MSQAQVDSTHREPVKAPEDTRKAAGGRRLHVPKRAIVVPLVALAAAGGATAWFFLSRPALPAGFASGNGRLEARQFFVSTKYPGRIAEVLVNEGDTVEAGQVIARMDTTALEAQLREAEAQIRSAQDARRVAEAQIAVKRADYDYAAKQDVRSAALVPRGAVSQREAEMDHAAALASKSQVVGAQASEVQARQQIDAATATADRLRAEIKDATLVAPMRGRVETRLAEPGEVLPQGGRVYSVNDLSDVYMYIFMPSDVSGRVPLGSEARIVLDAAPQYPIRAFVSFVSPMAQFTPKTVETAEERHNLTFRMKLQIDPNKLREYEPLVKTGLPGMGYVRWAQDKDWPANLQPKAIPANLWKPTGSSSGAP